MAKFKRPSVRGPHANTPRDQEIRTGLSGLARQTATRADGEGGKTSWRQSRRPHRESRLVADVAAFHDAGARRADDTTAQGIPLRRDAEPGQRVGASQLCAGCLQLPLHTETMGSLGLRRSSSSAGKAPAPRLESGNQSQTLMTSTPLLKWGSSGIPPPRFEPAGSANVAGLPRDCVAAQHAGHRPECARD